MSKLQNDIIKEAAWEDFCDLYDTSSSFESSVNDLMPDFESWYNKEYGRYNDEALENVFENLWKFDSELLCRAKRTCVEAYALYKNSMSQLMRMTNESNS